MYYVNRRIVLLSLTIHYYYSLFLSYNLFSRKFLYKSTPTNEKYHVITMKRIGIKNNLLTCDFQKHILCVIIILDVGHDYSDFSSWTRSSLGE